MTLSHSHGDVGPPDGPVTVVITRRAKSGKVKEFEEWLDGIVHEAMLFEGQLGVNVIRPADPSNPEYVIVFRFDTPENLKKWESSETRKEWLRKSKEVTEGDATKEITTGLEFWFTPLSKNAQTATVPPKYKMAIVTGAIVFVLLSTLVPLIGKLTSGLPAFLGTLVVVLVMVVLMTYVIMPAVTRLLSPWLSKKRIF
jgi:uncharacterized protein